MRSENFVGEERKILVGNDEVKECDHYTLPFVRWWKENITHTAQIECNGRFVGNPHIHRNNQLLCIFRC